MNQLSPAEKAKELLDKYYIEHYCWSGNGYDVDKVTTKKCQKQSALVAVNEILNVIKDIYCYDFDILNPYWQEVKTEIEKLKL
jgi:hypothetical protein